MKRMAGNARHVTSLRGGLIKTIVKQVCLIDAPQNCKRRRGAKEGECERGRERERDRDDDDDEQMLVKTNYQVSHSCKQTIKTRPEEKRTLAAHRDGGGGW